LLLCIFLVATTVAASAQTAVPGVPGKVTGGSSDVIVGGHPAARQLDTTDGGALVDGSPNVFINGKPAVTTGSRTNCGGVVMSGSKSVFINGKPIARSGDQTSGCAK